MAQVIMCTKDNLTQRISFGLKGILKDVSNLKAECEKTV